MPYNVLESKGEGFRVLRPDICIHSHPAHLNNLISGTDILQAFLFN